MTFKRSWDDFMIICSNCRKKNKRTDKFCSHCGKEITVEKSEVKLEYKKNHKDSASKFRTKHIIAIGIIFVFVLLLIGSSLFSKSAQGQLTLAYENGESIKPDKVLLDGNNVQTAEGKIDISKITKGSHTITISVSGVEYAEDFYYEGEGITIKLNKPIETYVAVFSQELNQPIYNVKIYSDGQIKCTTNSDGTCSFFEKPDKHTIKLQSDGIFYEEIKTIVSNSNSFTFKVSRTLSVNINVKDELTNNPLENAEVYIDGGYKGKTDSSGSFKIIDIKEGSHNLEIRYKSISKSQSIQVSSSQNNFELKIKAPRTITMELKDTETNKPINGMTIFLESSTSTYRSILPTDDNGRTTIENIMPEDYHIRLEGATGNQIKPSKLFTVSNSNIISETVDMPNPRFQLTVIPNDPWCMSGGITVDVKIANVGDEVSEDTTAIVLEYNIRGNTTELIGKDVIRFGGIAKGEITSVKTTKSLPNPCWDKQDIVVLVFDGSKYVPKEDLSSKLNIPQDKIIGIMSNALDYCNTNSLECVNAVGGFIGDILKGILAK